MSDAWLQQLDDATVSRFWTDGALCLRGAFRSWVEPLRVAVEEALDAPGPLAQNPARPGYKADGQTRAQSFHIELGLWSRLAPFRAFAFHSPAADIAARLLKCEDVDLFFDQLFVKEPGSPEQHTPWHQDQTYWPIRGSQVLSIWVPLDRVSSETGALRYVRGSHLWQRHFGPRDFGPGQRMLAGVEGEPVPDIDSDLERHEILSWDLDPGDCLVHHGMTLHAAPGNRSPSTRRRAHSIRFTGDDVVWDPRPGILERIPRMTTLPLTLRAGDRLRSEAFPCVRRAF